jgi:hypothetical protein
MLYPLELRAPRGKVSRRLDRRTPVGSGPAMTAEGHGSKRGRGRVITLHPTRLRLAAKRGTHFGNQLSGCVRFLDEARKTLAGEQVDDILFIVA